MIIVTTVIAVAFSSLFMIEYLFLNQGGVGISWLQPAPPHNGLQPMPPAAKLCKR